MENKKKTLSKIVIASAVFLMLSLCIVPASADGLPGHNETMITMTNGAVYNDTGDQYYFGFTKDGGGLNAIHISDSPEYAKKIGGIYGNNTNSGSFYITDMSKDPGCADSAILMFGVPENANLLGFSLDITASGYNWDLVGDGSFPSVTNNDHSDDVDIGTFTATDFTYEDDYKPYFDPDYPLYYDSPGGSDYKLMFIDLGLGLLNTTPSTLIDNGSIKIDYEINEGYSGNALFDIYSWRNQSTQGDKVVSWTNKLIGTKSSGWTINF